MVDNILVSVSDRIMEIRLSRPDKRNAITLAMYGAMLDAMERAAADDQIRALLFLGSEGHFTAGNDLADFQAAQVMTSDRGAFRFLEMLADFPKPMLAGVVGSAVGIGLTMLLHCDLVVAGRSTRFAAPFVDLGLVPEAASSLLLPALIGHQRAAKHLLLCEPFGAETALEYGIAVEVVDDGAVEEAIRGMAVRLAAKAPGAVMTSRKLMRGDVSGVKERMAEEAALFGERLHSSETAEAISAFFEKRAPRFE